MKSSNLVGFCLAGIFVAETANAQVESRTPSLTASLLDQRVVVLPIGTDGLRFLEVTATGTGCPPLESGDNSWEADISPDGKALTIMFSQYEADVGYGAATTTKFVSKDCTIAVTVHIPSGFTYAVQSFDYGGYVYLDRNIRATQRAEYYFQGDQVHSARGDTTMWGPEDRDYVLHDEIAIGALVWAPCGASRDLNIKTGLTLLNRAYDPNAYGYINTSVMDGMVMLTVNFAWATCYTDGH